MIITQPHIKQVEGAEDRQHVINSHKAEVDSLNIAIKVATETLKNLEVNIENVKAINLTEVEYGNELFKRVETAKAEKEKIDNEIAENIKSFKSIEDGFKSEIEMLKVEKEELKSELDKMGNDLISIRFEVDRAHEELKNVKKENEAGLEAHAIKFSNLLSNLDEKGKELEFVETRLKNMNGELGDRETVLNDINNSIMTTVRELRKLEKVHVDKKDDVSMLDTTLVEKRKEYEQLAKELEDTKMSMANVLVREQLLDKKKGEIMELYNKAGINIKI